MQSSRANVTGIDLEPKAVGYAQRFYAGPKYVVADVTEHGGVYDWVVSFETLEHLREPEKALAKFRASANLICSTPNQERFPFRSESYRNDRFPHIRHYTPGEFDALLERCGWTVKERFCQPGRESTVIEGTDGMFIVYVCS